MALENMPLQWFDKLNPGSIRGWEDLQRAFCENFAGQSEAGELRAQVHDITEREMIEPFPTELLLNGNFKIFAKKTQ
jgi:hypothetical protein